MSAVFEGKDEMVVEQALAKLIEYQAKARSLFIDFDALPAVVSHFLDDISVLDAEVGMPFRTEVRRLQRQLEEARKANEEHPYFALVQKVREERDAERDTVVQLRQALEPAVALLEGLKPWAMHSESVRTLCARLTLRLAQIPDEALAGAVPATETERADDELCICGHTAYWHTEHDDVPCEGSHFVAPGSFVSCECKGFVAAVPATDTASEACHICGEPRSETGKLFCSYPHPVSPEQVAGSTAEDTE